MSTYVYTAIESSGKSIKGQVEADNEIVALGRLHEQRFHVLSIRIGKSNVSAGGGKSSKTGKVKLREMVVFSRQFATMIDAGIPIVRCLDILEGQTKDPVLRPVISSCKRDVKGGLGLTDAFAKHPGVFSKLYVSMVKAAEAGGILDKILDRLSGFLEKEEEIKSKIKSAMIYPTIVLIFAGIMMIAMFMFVLPRFKEIFESMNVEMPPVTQALFSISDLARAYWYVPVIVGAGGFFLLRWYKNTDSGSWQIDRVKLRLPVVGDLISKMCISRFSRTFATLISSGVAMMRSLEIVAETSGNRVVAHAIDGARSAIREGQKISTPLASSGLFPGMVTHMIDVGEETGRLSEMLIKVSDFYDQEVDNSVKALTSLIEPLLIVVMGCVVGFIAVSIMSPIFKLISSVN